MHDYYFFVTNYNVGFEVGSRSRETSPLQMLFRHQSVLFQWVNKSFEIKIHRTKTL